MQLPLGAGSRLVARQRHAACRFFPCVSEHQATLHYPLTCSASGDASRGYRGHGSSACGPWVAPRAIRHFYRPPTTRAASAASGDGSTTENSGSNGWPPLDEWLRANGGTVNGVRLNTVLYPSGAADRQLVAAADHPPGALLITVPRHLQLRYDNVERAAEGAAPATSSAAAASPSSRVPGPDPAAAFAIPPADAAALVSLFGRMPPGSDTGGPAWQFKQALTLLYELSRGSAGPLAPYLAALPGIAPGVPTPRVAMLMHAEAVQELQYGTLVQDVTNQQYWLRHVCSREEGGALAALGRAAGGDGGGCADPFGGRLEVAEGLFGWAAAVAMSRSFGLSRSAAHTCVPLVDMANHVAPHGAANCEIAVELDGEVTMRARRQIASGEELTLTYGSHDNRNLLLSYGFSLEPNPFEALWFDFDMEALQNLVEGHADLPLAPWQLDLLASAFGLGPGQPPRAVYLAAAPPPPQGQQQQPQGPPPQAESARSVGSGEEGGPAAPSSAQPPSAAALASGPSGGGRTGPPTQPVDPLLLGALRVATLQDPAWAAQLQGRGAAALGGWGRPLARQQEGTLMRLLAALVTAIYSSFPTTIQQDRKLLAAASLEVAAAAAAVTLVTQGGGGGQGARWGGGGRWPLQPRCLPGPALEGAAAVEADKAEAAAARARDVAEAVRYRLGLKTALERCLQALVARAKELDALQTVR